MPPSVETRHCPPGPGNGRTYTSKVLPASVESVRDPSAVRREHRNDLVRRRAEKHGGRAGRPTASGIALHRQDHQVRCRWRRDRRGTPGTCRWDATTTAVWSSGLSVSRVTSPVPSAFTQYKLLMPGLARSDANTMRRPSGVQTGIPILTGVEGQLRQRVPRPVVHPDVALLAVGDVERQLLAVRREPRIRPVGLRRAEHRRLAVARHPVDRIARSSRPRRARTRACPPRTRPVARRR